MSLDKNIINILATYKMCLRPLQVYNQIQYGIEYKRIVIEMVAGKPEGKIPLGKSWIRWENIIKVGMCCVFCKHGNEPAGFV
jgi:hypothetical protein